ncbi:MAG TPA: M48 family metallopeptidase [Tepidisphaeraceae bacterium]|jgi:STE24 endopeptidase|nr:M48 family metallopeptidase [Tepidisphaeraceae bacterium]
MLFLLLVVVLWMASGTGATAPHQPADLRTGLAGFFGFYVILILMMGLWSRALARSVGLFDAHLNLRRFHKMMLFARMMVPLAFGVGVFWLGWGWLVHERLGVVPAAWPVKLPNVLIGIAPAILAWVGLWWSQYPADRAIREQNMLLQLEAGLPVHAPPRFLRYLTANVRLQVLFVILPILLVIALRDVVVVIARMVDPGLPITEGVDSAASVIALVTVFAFAPILLCRVLDTKPLPNGPLRDRLQRLCDRTGMQARGILLWQTNGLMGNAAVMGLFPRVRYILMTDVLLETMSDAQIEAVFAHEIGHVRHRHMLWYVGLVAIFTLLSLGPGEWANAWLVGRLGNSEWLQLAQVLAGLALFWISFGFVSRRFERQADVFAARTIAGAEPATAVLPPNTVSPYGATLFASALRRVAVVNNIPLARPEWIHGSIASRMQFVQSLAESPDRTHRFDRQIGLLHVGLVLLLITAATLAWTTTLSN